MKQKCGFNLCEEEASLTINFRHGTPQSVTVHACRDHSFQIVEDYYASEASENTFQIVKKPEAYRQT